MNIDKLTKEYLHSVEIEWSKLRLGIAEDSKSISLEKVFVGLNATQTILIPPLDNRDELVETTERHKLENSYFLKRNSNPEKPNKQDFPVQLSALTAVKENQHLVFLGEPGSGKSTLLKFIGLCFAKQEACWPEKFLHMNENRVPIFLRLSDFSKQIERLETPSFLYEYLTNAVTNKIQNPSNAREMIKKWSDPHNNRLLILLDGLDESKERALVIEKVREFANSTIGQNSRIIITTRLAGYGTLSDSRQSEKAQSFKEFTLQPLKDHEINNYVTGWFCELHSNWSVAKTTDETEKLTKRLESQPGLKHLCTNPLFLSMFIQTSQFADFAKNRAELYDSFVKNQWERAKEQGVAHDLKHIIDELEALAWHIHAGGDSSESNLFANTILKHPPGLSDNLGISQDCISIARKNMGLLANVQGHLSFIHTRLHCKKDAIKLIQIALSSVSEKFNIIRAHQ